MFGFGDFGRAAKAVAKKRALSRKTGSKRLLRTPKVAKRVYPRKKTMKPIYGPGYVPPSMFDDEEEGGFFRPMTRFAPEGVPMGPGGRTVTIGRPTPHTRTVCGCKVATMKNGHKAIVCPNAGPKGGKMTRFASKTDLARAKGAETLCTQIPTFTPHRGPRRPNPYSFLTSRGKKISFGRKPSEKTAQKYTAYYYHKLGLRNKKQGKKTLFQPSFADINGWGW